ncbi:ATP-binding protein [Streptomyces sp. DHE7-1]|uniref:ATP-binding protein n=1 Tax=Streptomyces sp. NPDC093248 TaxID=3155072 RepID=UPI0018EE7D8B|nr:ATP-binding protein [Streptomyces sp. DHE7-1]
MKQSAAKTLGVAALGAAFAAVGAGAAEAAPAAPVAAPQALDSVTTALPAQNVGQALAQGQGALGTGGTTAQPVVGNVLAGGPTAPLAGLLGGLPLQSMPTQGVAVNGLPIG